MNLGSLVPLSRGADGLADSVVACLSRDLDIPEIVIGSLPEPRSAAKKHIALYRTLSPATE